MILTISNSNLAQTRRTLCVVIGACVIVLAQACSSNSTPNEYSSSDSDIRYEYSGDICEKSSLEDVNNLGGGYNINFDFVERESQSAGFLTVYCDTEIERNEDREIGDDEWNSEFQIQAKIIDRIDLLHIHNDPLWQRESNTNPPVAFLDDEVEVDDWDYAQVRSRSSVNGYYRFVDVHVQHEHLIINTAMRLGPNSLSENVPDHPDDGTVAHPMGIMFEDDFDEEIWEDAQQFDDDFQQEFIDFNFEVADNLKQALLKDGGLSSL